ncbi:winged helix-turn-helix domain-containing protein [Actinomadura sp. 3N407]|uniref:winged helix-turn-helix domain-containing protein n=1 Tax=Actinomadura sp. 3N407 TaxID=3457423 RepID=UPI003FCD8D4A
MVKRTGQPGYLQIADDLRQQINDGRLAPGQSLPSTARLGEEYDVSAGVVKAAISVLRTEGMVIGQQGKGVFVRDQADTDPTSQAAPAAEADVTTKQLTEVLAAVRDLGERVARIERTVFSERPQADQPGK